MYVCLHAPTHVHVCRLARGSFVTWLAFIHSPVCVDGCIVAVVGMGPGEDTAFVGSACLHRLICALAGHLSKMGNAFKKTERSFQDPVDPSSTAGVTRTRSVWVKHYDPDAKCHYYHNAKTGHSTWTEKELLAGLETIREQATVEAEDYASPEEWVRHYDDVSKHHYYSNKELFRTIHDVAREGSKNFSMKRFVWAVLRAGYQYTIGARHGAQKPLTDLLF